MNVVYEMIVLLQGYFLITLIVQTFNHFQELYG